MSMPSEVRMWSFFARGPRLDRPGCRARASPGKVDRVLVVIMLLGVACDRRLPAIAVECEVQRVPAGRYRRTTVRDDQDCRLAAVGQHDNRHGDVELDPMAEQRRSEPDGMNDADATDTKLRYRGERRDALGLRDGEPLAHLRLRSWRSPGARSV